MNRNAVFIIQVNNGQFPNDKIIEGFKLFMEAPFRVPTFYEFIGPNYKEILFPYDQLVLRSISIWNATNELVYKTAIEEYTQDGNKFRKLNPNGTYEIFANSPTAETLENFNIGGQYIFLTPGTYEIEYDGRVAEPRDLVKYRATFNVVENHYPTKPWTITEVINRTFDLIEPLDYGEKPRFRLSGVGYDNEGNAEFIESGSIAEKYDKVLAPEFSFTKMTLREQLQQVGGFIHGEPRVKQIHFDEERPWFEIGFDKYGSNQKAKIKDLKKPVTIALSTDINNYATKLDSTADNLINQLDFASGVIIEPFKNGEQSLRCETTYVRLGEDNNTFISTTLPIYKIKKVYCTYIPNNDDITEDVDITPYTFEEADYNNLSSYEGTYPYAKAYGIYYTQGQKNIRGLFFKVEDAINTSAFSRYSIINILRSATGKDITKPVPHNYPLLHFRVEYVPLYGARIQTNKQTIIGGLPRSMNYNQSANAIESRYYGENLKGVIARMGNVEKTMTYNLAFISDIPKIGTKFDDHYYISTVSVEYLPSYIKCTIGLSKDFNRLSEYIGISSNKRMWEVSEKQSQERDSIHTEYVLITENENETDDSNWFMNTSPCILLNYNRVSYPISAMNVKTISKRLNELHKITLPVVSSTFGNSMTFTSAFEDNYSAGQGVVQRVGEGFANAVSGNWAYSVPYGDYYGRAFYLYYELYAGNNIGFVDGGGMSNPNAYVGSPGGTIGSTVYYGKKYRKDSREIPQITFELAVVTDSEDIIIGSAITKNCSLVNPSPQDIELWVFKEDINKVDSRIDFDGAMQISGFSINSNSVVIPAIPSGYSSWALVTKRTTEKITVEDEDGDVSTIDIYNGGELILGQNKVFANAKTFYFRKKKKIYD